MTDPTPPARDDPADAASDVPSRLSGDRPVADADGASTEGLTVALDALSRGDPDALERVLPLAYDELRALARRQLRNERDDHTLRATALVHEAWVRLAGLDRIEWEGRAHFFGVAAGVMRRILVSYARMKGAGKRGGRSLHVPLDDVIVAARERPDDLLDLDDALHRLRDVDERMARVVECRFFADLSVEETAEALDVSPATVKRDWALARAWLNRELTG